MCVFLHGKGAERPCHHVDRYREGSPSNQSKWATRVRLGSISISQVESGTRPARFHHQDIGSEDFHKQLDNRTNFSYQPNLVYLCAN